MSTCNRFGATVADVLLQYKTGSYSPVSDEFGGDDAILDVLDQMEGALLDALPPRLFQTLSRPDLLRVVPRATAGQISFRVPAIFRPIVPGSMHLWRGWPASFQDRPRLLTDPNNGEAYLRNVGGFGPGIRYSPSAEMAADSFSVDNSTGMVTLTEPLMADHTVFASFEVDVSAVAYSVPSLANILANGAAGDLGAKVYPRATDAWALVDHFVEGFAAAIDLIGKGERVPPEVRVLQWWQEVEKAQENRIGSARLYRGG